jgi:hypothetical protein
MSKKITRKRRKFSTILCDVCWCSIDPKDVKCYNFPQKILCKQCLKMEIITPASEIERSCELSPLIIIDEANLSFIDGVNKHFLEFFPNRYVDRPISVEAQRHFWNVYLFSARAIHLIFVHLSWFSAVKYYRALDEIVASPPMVKKEKNFENVEFEWDAMVHVSLYDENHRTNYPNRFRLWYRILHSINSQSLLSVRHENVVRAILLCFCQLCSSKVNH